MTQPALAPLLFVPVSAVALLAGAGLLARLRLVDDRTPGRLLYELAAGYMLLAYALAVAGLVGLLTLPVAGAILGAALLLGLGEARQCLARLRSVVALVVGAVSVGGGPWPLVGAGAATALPVLLVLLGTGVMGLGVLVAAGACVLALGVVALWRPSCGLAWLLLAWGAITFLGALAPPAAHDYDGLAQHLAHAKVYARTGHYAPLWYDHHSHFPALTQMLFSLGMLLQGAALAKLFHWSFGMIALGAAVVAARRFICPGSGKWAAVMLASMPIMGWLVQVGYVDLPVAAYGLLAVTAFLHWRREPALPRLALCGLMAGGMMGAKMQGLALFGVLVVAVGVTALSRRMPARRAGAALAAVGLTGALVAAPWYVKTWIVTGNPVYPFAYGVFGGKWWGENEARAYAYDQKSFGMEHLPPPEVYEGLTPVGRLFAGPRRPLNLLLAPWNLTFNPVPFSAQWRQGAAALPGVLASQWIGPLHLAGLAALAGLWLSDRRRGGRRWPRAVSGLLWLFVPLWLWWLMSMQLDRYLVPSLALLAPLAAYAWRRLERTALRALPVLWMTVALGIVGYLSAMDLAVVAGMLPQEQYLRAMCPVHEASVAVNRVTPPDGRVILYGEPRGFYIDRDYLWGDPGHHRMIPYERLQTPETLVAHLRGMGVTHALIGLAQTGGANAGPPVSLLYEAVERGLARVASEEDLMRRGYVILEIGG